MATDIFPDRWLYLGPDAPLKRLPCLLSLQMEIVQDLRPKVLLPVRTPKCPVHGRQDLTVVSAH